MKALDSPALRGFLAGALLALTLAAIGLLALREVASRPPPLEIVLPTATTVPAEVTVHLAGEVARPGLYTFPAGTRLHAAIQAAGGASAEADLDALNLALVLADGQRYLVPRAGAGGAPAPTSVGPGPVDLNIASAAELDALVDGIGPELAGRIVAYRQANGPFQRVEDLLSVRGIGDTLLERIRPQVVVR